MSIDQDFRCHMTSLVHNDLISAILWRYDDKLIGVANQLLCRDDLFEANIIISKTLHLIFTLQKFFYHIIDDPIIYKILQKLKQNEHTQSWYHVIGAFVWRSYTSEWFPQRTIPVLILFNINLNYVTIQMRHYSRRIWLPSMLWSSTLYYKFKSITHSHHMELNTNKRKRMFIDSFHHHTIRLT